MLYLKRILLVGLSFVVGLINIIGNNYTVFALEKNTLVHQNVMSMIQSQRGGLFDPIYTESLEDNWQGDYIYYGEDTDGSALKWHTITRRRKPLRPLVRWTNPMATSFSRDRPCL